MTQAPPSSQQPWKPALARERVRLYRALATGWWGTKVLHDEESGVSAMIEICETPTEAERAAILKPLLEFNRCAVGDAGHSRVAILIRDDNTSEVTGGLWASVFYNWLYVELLCVPEAARGSGIGTALLATAESIAIARNCVGVWLDTYEFQAPAFYEKLGYEVFARLPQYPKGYERFFLKKMVDNAATG